MTPFYLNVTFCNSRGGKNLWEGPGDTGESAPGCESDCALYDVDDIYIMWDIIYIYVDDMIALRGRGITTG